LAAKRRQYSLRLALGFLALVVFIVAIFFFPTRTPQTAAAEDKNSPLTQYTQQVSDPIQVPKNPALDATQLINQVETPVYLENQNALISPSENAPILYYAQSGDSLDVLALRFGVAVDEIASPDPLSEGGFIPEGQLLLIPSRLVETSDSLRLFPDSEVINSPSAIDFDVASYIQTAGGKLANYHQFVYSFGYMTGTDIINLVSRDYSIHPRLLLALLEYQSGWVLGTSSTNDHENFPMGFIIEGESGLYNQMVMAVGKLGTGYYGWREGTLLALTFPDGTSLRLNPELNCGTVAWMYFFSQMYNYEDWYKALYSENGLLATYEFMFGNPWLIAQQFPPIFTPELEQPPLELPFESGVVWSFTSGPHAAWGAVEVRAALDFAPPLESPGCHPTSQWVTSASPGLVVRSETGTVVVDMDRDGNEQTGWNVVYLHVGVTGRVLSGTWVNTGDRIGHPSCEGGISTGTHLHIVRKYNGEWIPADGPLPFELGGWVTKVASQPYQGWLIKDDQIIKSSVFGATKSHIVNSN